MRLQRILGYLGVLLMLALLGYTAYATWPTRAASSPQAGPTAQVPFPEPSDPGHRRAFHEICPAINRPEVIAVLGGGPVTGQGTSYTSDSLLCNVSTKDTALRLEVGAHLSVKSLKLVSRNGRSLTVQGRPAILETSTGSLSRSTLTIARESSDTGDFASILLLTPDHPADEATMVGLAELILPHVAGWTV